jgi:hypothetical protein
MNPSDNQTTTAKTMYQNHKTSQMEKLVLQINLSFLHKDVLWPTLNPFYIDTDSVKES